MKKFLSVIIIICFLISVFGCKQKEITKTNYAAEKAIEENPFQFAFDAFDTQCSITMYGVDTAQGQAYADDMRAVIDKYEEMLSKTKEGSDIYDINHRTGDSVMITDMTANLLALGSEFYNWSGGKFDISSGTLINLWDVKNRKTVPSQEEINEARKHCGNFNYVIERDVEPDSLRCNRITFNGDPKTQYDLGALVKGYVCDSLKDMLAENENIKACIINLGGNVCVTGKLDNRKDGAFNIGIFKPFSTSNEIIETVKVVDRNVITSGVYQRYFKVPGDDRIYHHIIDPSTGYPTDNGIYSASIISENGLLGDYLSTSAMLVGVKGTEQLIDSLGKRFGDKNIQAIFVDSNNMVTKYPKKVKTY